MKRFKFFTDVHEYGCYEIPCQWEFGEDCFYLGDNVDLSCCRPEDIESARLKLRAYKHAFKGRFVSGNHELEEVNHLKVGNVLLTHGDYIFWPKAQADAYRRRKPGMGAIMRFAVKWAVGVFLAQRDWEINRLMKHRCLQLARKYGCSTIVCGHWHPRTLQDFVYRGVRIVVLPRGRTDIDL